MPAFEPVTITTRRLRLRPMREDDWRAGFALWSDADAMRYFSFPPMTDPAQAIERTSRLAARSANGEDLVCVLELLATGEPIGDCSLFDHDAQCRRAQIGFSLQRRCWRNGYMTEAGSALLDHAFDTLGLRRLEADIDPRNEASARVLERLGFVREGLLRERWQVGDEVSDSAIYGLLARDPRPVAAATPSLSDLAGR
ncbi:GNAT family N-acetyltransferase [Burkholderia gladioli]|uniref:GCN5-related N-acetyltransferase n=1 Tax=Burkholderia gladioli (strain BSR3) TaxID=999541 RepID=F2LD57_BURGS|nr:GNAT family N-acetyltransferase [Burkholderia gladioli]AEA59916.1 GCN5-related N-acetyltransferase [Burkholderia gladioli BSR3]MBW5286264.1 GNAT family N-acetyltransferase [Burkholderia gladioli]NHH80421.1 putative ribosomal N-acetyltransferase YdaF [Burkholderia gladioli]CAG9223594.1 GCN5-related N-acetyltransferase [Burkholderia gladioli]